MRDRKFWVMAMGAFVLGVFVFSLVNVGLHFTGFAVFSEGPGEGQTTLMLQDADSDNLGDAYIGASGDANKNFGSNVLLKLGSVARTYINFNISGVPDNQNIDSSTLCLYVLNTKKTQLINVNQVYVDFDESILTWNNQPCGINFDNSSACNLTAESSFQMNSGFENTWICWDVANMVGSAYNLGNSISIIISTSDADTNSFNSKEAGDSSLRPYLNITYSVANVAPVVGLVLPEEGNSYGYNESILLNFSVFDSDDNLDSCWYNVGGENISITGCLNTSFNVSGNGDYILGIYANDSLGLEASDSVGFSVAVGAPTISLNSPVDGVYLGSGENVQFSYVPTDIDLESCELWGNFDGDFEMSQVDVFPTSGVVNNFYLNLSDGEYLWNVKCNDSVGNFAFNGNKIFSVDTVNPNVSLSQPVGKKTSRVVVSNWVVSDASPVSCKYNVYRGESVEVANISVNCSNGVVNFSVTVDADFVFNFYASDFAGNSNFKSLSFNVDTSSVVVNPPSDGSSGGGGGYFIGSLARFEIDEIRAIVSRGEEKSLSVEVKNIGSTSVNKCRLVGGDFVDSNDVYNIGAGEIVEFRFVLRALEGVENLELKVKCLDNVSGVVPLSVRVLKPSLDVAILGISFDSNDDLRVDYSVEPTGDSVSILYFRVLDSDENIVSEVIENVELVFGEVYEGSVLMSVGDIDEGMLRVVISDGDVNFVEEDFVYSGGVGVTGFASLNLSGDFSYIGIILVVFLVLAGLLVRRIWKLRKEIKKK